jgi:uncharacterized tellurite resistance protein B-like protein
MTNVDVIDTRIDGDELIIETKNSTEVYDSRFIVAAMLVYVAKGDGNISSLETEKMLQLVSINFDLRSSESLDLLTRAMSELSENPDLMGLIGELGKYLSADEKESIAVMLLKVIAADGRQAAEEMDALSEVSDVLEISPETMHRAFDRYFDDKAN